MVNRTKFTFITKMIFAFIVVIAMGIIAVLLFSTGYLGPTFYVPTWVIFACYSAIALGTVSGGWKVIKTLGVGLTDLKPVGGFCAETAGAITVIGSSLAGIPVSTTHTITGSIMGVGLTRRLSAVRWGIAGNIVIAWTISTRILRCTCLAEFSIGSGHYHLVHLTQPPWRKGF